MSKLWRRNRRDDSEDRVHIDGDSGHQWWASRAELDGTIDRRWRRDSPGGRYPFRRATDDPAEHLRRTGPTPSSGMFATSEAEGHERFDPDALFRTGSADTSTTDEATHRQPPWFSEAAEPATGGGATEPWATLGLTSEATWTEVTRRHRELVKEHHPDRHSHSSDTERAAAEDRMATINSAYNDLAEIYRLTQDH